MSIKTFPRTLDSTLYTLTWKDQLYNNLNDYLYSSGTIFNSINKFKSLTDKGYLASRIGKDSKCVYEELYFYKAFIKYLILAKDEIIKSGANITTVKASYLLATVRNNAICRYINSEIIDNLINIAGVDITSLGGIGYDIIACDFTSGNELQVNGDFSLSSGGWYDSGGVLLTALTNPYNGAATTGGPIKSGAILTVGKSYTINFDFIYGGLGTSGQLWCNGVSFPTFNQIFNVSGFYSFSFIAGDNKYYFTNIAPGNGNTIDNVSIKELITPIGGQCSQSPNIIIQ